MAAIYQWFGGLNIAQFNFTNACGQLADQIEDTLSWNYSGDRASTGWAATPVAGPIEPTYRILAEDFYWAPALPGTPNAVGIEGRKTFALTGWMYNSLFAGFNTFGVIFYRGLAAASSAADRDFMFAYYNNTNKFLWQFCSGSSSQSLASSVVPQTGVWYFFCVYYDHDTKEIGMSITKQGDPLQVFETTILTSEFNLNDEVYVLGHGPISGSNWSWGFNGYFNEFLLWRNKIPTIAQLQDLYADGIGSSIADLPWRPTPPPLPYNLETYLRAWNTYDEASGQSRKDSYGYNNFNEVGTSSPAQTVGVVDEAGQTTFTPLPSTAYAAFRRFGYFWYTKQQWTDYRGSGSWGTAFWVKFDELPTAGDFATVMARADDDHTPFDQWFIDYWLYVDGDDGKLKFRNYHGGSPGGGHNEIVHTVALQIDTWYFIACGYERNTLDIMLSVTKRYDPLNDYEITDMTDCPRAGNDIGSSIGANAIKFGYLTNVSTSGNTWRRRAKIQIDNVGHWWRSLNYTDDLPTLYGNGDGCTLDDIKESVFYPADSPIVKLVSAWEMNEELTGWRADSHGPNTLTSAGTGTVTGTVGFIENASEFHGADALVCSGPGSGMDSVGSFSGIVVANFYDLSQHRHLITKARINSFQIQHMDWGVRYNVSTDILDFFIVNNSFTLFKVECLEIGSPSIGITYYIYFEYDSVANEIKLRVNNGTLYTVSVSGVLNNQADAINVGRLSSRSDTGWGRYMNGWIDHLYLFNDGLATNEETFMNNGNKGRRYQELRG